MVQHVVLGASGGWGSAIVHELVKQGKKVRGVTRSGKAPVPEKVEMVKADITERNSLVNAIKDATQVYHCVNLPYNKWENNLVQLTETVISAIEEVNVPLLVTDNLYMYPENASAPLSEEMPWTASTRKGKVRAECAKRFLKAHDEGRIQVTMVRAPDFFGPRVKNAFYGTPLFKAAIEGKRLQLFGSLDVPHQIAYTPDLARASVLIAEDKSSYGQVWHLPSDKAITQREFATLVANATGNPVKVRSLGKNAVKIIGIFDKIIREVSEMLYEFEKPYLVSHQKFMSKYDFEITPLRNAIEETVNWFRLHDDVF